MNYVNKVELLQFYVPPAHTQELINSPCPRPLWTRIFYLNYWLRASSTFTEIKESESACAMWYNALDPRKNQSVIPDGYCRIVRRGLHSATVTQLWYRSTSNTTVRYMERVDDKTKANASGRTSNNLHESRFKKILFIFRLSGLPIKLQPVSRIYKLYSATITVCFCTTTMCLLMDTFVHRHQLNYAMKKLRVFIAFALALCLHINVR